MKTYQKGNYTVYEFEFLSVIDFLNYLEENPINTQFFSENNLSSNKSDFAWTKTANFEEAANLLKFGYHEDFDKLLKLKDSLERYIKVGAKNGKQHHDFVGYAPDVKAYLEGDPMAMYNRTPPKRNKISVFYNCANLSNVTTSQIYNRGVITLTLVELLEKMGFNVDLKVFTMSEKDDEIHYAKFLLKRENERLNIQKLYFPMCHPSFLRRLVFRLREETMGVKRNWSKNYGVTCGSNLTSNIIELEHNDIIICKPDELGIRGHDILKDAENTLKYIENKEKTLTLKLPKIYRDDK